MNAQVWWEVGEDILFPKGGWVAYHRGVGLTELVAVCRCRVVHTPIAGNRDMIKDSIELRSAQQFDWAAPDKGRAGCTEAPPFRPRPAVGITWTNSERGVKCQ